MGQTSVRKMAVGALVAAVMLLGSFQAPHRHVHTAIRCRGHAGAQSSVAHPLFSLDSSDTQDGDWQVAAHVSTLLPQLGAQSAGSVQLVPRIRQLGFTPVPIRRLKLPPRSNEPTLSV